MVPQPTATSRGLEALPARPPTPPREKQHEPESGGSRRRHVLNARPSLQTPPNHHSPDSTASTDNTARRERKKVGFSAEAQYREAPTYVVDKENAIKHMTPVSASSSTASSKPIKSILKPSIHTNPLDRSAGTDEASRQVNLAVMLESTIKQLAGADRDSKLDSYMMLVRALKVSNNLPDRIALQDKMSLFMQFIQRDITTKTATGSLDSSLVNHALLLLITFLHFPAIASTLSNDFGVFIIDHSIRSFEDSTIPKDVARHLMQVVASQDFSAKVMTADRVGRLVIALHNIEEHLKGKSIIMSRVIIYRRLIKQAKMQMVTHSDWLRDLFTDMLSGMKEIRAAAVFLGLEAVAAIGKEKQLTKKVMEILQLTVDETKYIEYYVEKLREMVKNKEESAAVPQIWSVVILLLRCPVDRWEHFGPWLEIIQKCFNSSDHSTKLEANYAWNRLVYALQFHESSFTKTLATVCQPFLSQLKRKVTNKQQEGLRKVVLGSICNLYYYTFKPNSNPVQLDSYWDICVRPLIRQLAFPELEGKSVEKSAAAAEENLTQATLMITRLFDATTPRLWKEDHVFESPLVKLDELPALDPKWTRRNTPKVFGVVEPIMQKSFLDLSRRGSNAQRLWRTLVGAVATAASKEVKVSTDTAVFVAHAYGLLVKLWTPGLSSHPDESPQKLLDATHEYISTMVESLGLLPFTEKLLSVSKQNTFTPVATPSHRSGKGQGLSRTPLHHLFLILSTTPPNVPDDESFCGFMKAVFGPFFAAKSSSMKSELANDLMRLLPMDALAPYGPWVLVSETLDSTLDSQASHSTTTSGSGPTVGHEYRDVVKHLERGLRSTPRLPWSYWQSLFHSLTSRVADESGEAGVAIAVIEPLAKALVDALAMSQDSSPSVIMSKAGIEMIAAAKHPRDKQALDAARRRVWGTSVAGSRTASFDPFDSFYKLTVSVLSTTYSRDARVSDNEDLCVSLLSQIAGFLARCHHSLVFKTLCQLQHGLALWVQDNDNVYSSKQSPVVSEAVKTLWERIGSVLVDTEKLADFQLTVIEPLLCSAFESKHRHIVNAVCASWNRAFEHVDTIEYPEKLKATLIALRPHIDIVLPGLELPSDESSGPPPSFVESQDDFDALQLPFAKPVSTTTPASDQPSSSRQSSPNAAVNFHLLGQRRLERTPDVIRGKSAKRSSAPRLRHDNSQIEFAAIESSSPSRVALESQILTDRQKEIRERQRANAGMFPEMRSSPEKQSASAPDVEPTSGEVELPQPVKEANATTPEPDNRYEDYVSSTPTPRRGQAPIIEDYNEMEDIPSSPPEPRRNLYSAMQTRSRSSSMLDEFQFSSSPISGSPVQNRLSIADDHEVDESNVQMAQTAEATRDASAENEARDDEALSAPATLAQATEIRRPEKRRRAVERPTTPTGTRRSGFAPDATPDNEEFVDALTSPIHTTPRALRAASGRLREALASAQPMQTGGQSFEISDGEEQGFARLVVELDSRKCEPMPVYDGSSPAKAPQPDEPIMDCITVNDGEEKGRGKRKRTRSSQVSQSPAPEPKPESEPEPEPEPVPATLAEATEASQSTGKASRRKRKRASEKAQSQGGKRRRHRKYVDAEEFSSQEQSQATSPSSVDADVSMEIENSVDTSFSQESSIVTESSGAEMESQAVNMQILTEASQETSQRVEEQASDDLPDKEDDIPKQEVPASKSSLETIMQSLRGGLEGLRAATLSRDEVYKIEDMFMDIKKELYDAERRGRAERG